MNYFHSVHWGIKPPPPPLPKKKTPPLSEAHPASRKGGRWGVHTIILLQERICVAVDAILATTLDAWLIIKMTNQTFKVLIYKMSS